MSTASITSKGQVTIPAKIRRLLSLKPGDRLLFESEGHEVRIRALSKRVITDFLGAFKTAEPFPGKEAVRDATAKSLARRHKGPRS
jgi:AbrB family looped-hinge helix DNA binding protein